MRVLLPYASNYVDISQGGIQSFILRTVRNLPKNVDLTMIGIGKKPANLDSQISWISLFSEKECSKRNLHYFFAKKLRDYNDTIMDFDVILHHRPETLLFIKNKRNVLVLHSPTFGAFKTRTFFKGLILVLFEFIASKKAKLIVTVNESSISRVTRMLNKEVSEVPVPVSSNFFLPECPPNSHRLIYVGRLEIGKRVESLLDLALRLQCKILIIGDGNELSVLKGKALALNIDAEFYGFLSEEEIIKIYRNGGYFVSASESEGFPISVIEALASRLPVVLFGNGTWISGMLKLGVNVSNIESFNFLQHKIMGESQWQYLHENYSEKSASNKFWKKVINPKFGENDLIP